MKETGRQTGRQTDRQREIERERERERKEKKGNKMPQVTMFICSTLMMHLIMKWCNHTILKYLKREQTIKSPSPTMKTRQRPKR